MSDVTGPIFTTVASAVIVINNPINFYTAGGPVTSSVTVPCVYSNYRGLYYIDRLFRLPAGARVCVCLHCTAHVS